MFTQLVGGATLTLLVLIALDDYIRSNSGTSPIAKRNAKLTDADITAADPKP